MIDQVFFDPDVPRQHVRQESISERRLGMELPHHFGSLHDDDRRPSHVRRRRHPQRLANETEVPVHLVDAPLECVVLGAGRCIEAYDSLKVMFMGSNR